MTWEQTKTTDDRIEWERADGYARVTVRKTATGAWTVVLDRLEQAPDGEAYRHETVADRTEAIDVAEAWRRANDLA